MRMRKKQRNRRRLLGKERKLTSTLTTTKTSHLWKVINILLSRTKSKWKFQLYRQNRNAIYQNPWNPDKVVLGGTFMPFHVHIKKGVSENLHVTFFQTCLDIFKCTDIFQEQFPEQYQKYKSVYSNSVFFLFCHIYFNTLFMYIYLFLLHISKKVANIMPLNPKFFKVCFLQTRK